MLFFDAFLNKFNGRLDHVNHGYFCSLALCTLPLQTFFIIRRITGRTRAAGASLLLALLALVLFAVALFPLLLFASLDLSLCFGRFEGETSFFSQSNAFGLGKCFLFKSDSLCLLRKSDSFGFLFKSDSLCFLRKSDSFGFLFKSYSLCFLNFCLFTFMSIAAFCIKGIDAFSFCLRFSNLSSDALCTLHLQTFFIIRRITRRTRAAGASLLLALLALVLFAVTLFPLLLFTSLHLYVCFGRFERETSFLSQSNAFGFGKCFLFKSDSLCFLLFSLFTCKGI